MRVTVSEWGGHAVTESHCGFALSYMHAHVDYSHPCNNKRNLLPTFHITSQRSRHPTEEGEEEEEDDDDGDDDGHLRNWGL